MGSESVQVCSPVVKCIIIVMIVLKILILFIPLLLMAEASFKIGPFHRHPLPSIPWGSRTISTNSPADQREPKSSQYNPPYHVITDGRHTDTSRYNNILLTSSPRAPLEFSTKSPVEEQTSPSVQVHPVYPGPTGEPGSVDSATIPTNIATDSSVQIETTKLTFSNSPHLVYTDNRHHDTRPYHVPKPASSPWSPPEFPTLPSVDVNKSQVYGDGRHTDTGRYHNTPLTSSTTAPLEFSTKSPVEEQTSPSVQVHPVYPGPTEKSVSVDSATIPPNIATDSSVQIETSKSVLSNSPHLIYTVNRHRGSRPYHVPKRASNPWSPPEFPTLSSVDVNKPQVYADGRHTDTGRYHNTPLTSSPRALLEFSTKSPVEERTSPSVQVHPVYPSPTEKSVSVDSSTIPPNIATDSSVQIETSTPALSNSLHLLYTDNRHQGTRLYHVPKSAPSPLRVPKFSTFQSSDVSEQQVYTNGRHTDTGRYHNTPLTSSPRAPLEFFTKSPVEEQTSPSVNVSSVSPDPTGKLVSVDSATIPPNIATDSSVQIETSKPALSNSPHLIYTDRHQGTIPYHVPKLAPSLWSPPKYPTPLSLQLGKQPVHVRSDSYLYQTPPPVTPEKPFVENVSAFPTSNINNFSVTDMPRISQPKKPQPIHAIQRRQNTEIGPFIRPPRSANQQTWNSIAENWIAQNITLQPEETAAPPESILHSFICPQPYGYFKYTDQCDEYIECKNNVPLAFLCPAGLHFNPGVEWTEYPCDHPSKVQCNVEPTTPPSSTASQPENAQSPKVVTTPRPYNQQPDYVLCPQPHGYFKFSDHCGEYIECKNHIPLIFTCPDGLHFNPLVEWTEYPCDHPSNVLCDSEIFPQPTPESTTGPPPPPPPITRSPPPPITRLPPPPPTTKPPPPLTTRPPPLPTTRPPPPPTIAGGGGRLIKRPLPPSSPPTTNPPPTTTIWQTTPPPPTTLPPTTQPPTTLPPPPPSTEPPVVITPDANKQPNYDLCPQPHGYFKFSDQCDEYIECKNYIPLIFTCPDGLHFNPLAEWTEYPCDHPSKVQCNGEPVDPITPSTTEPPAASTTESLTTPQPGNELRDFKCPETNGYFKFNDECGEYIECKNDIPHIYACPDGLHFNVFANWTEYPCDHPANVQCNKEIDSKQPIENPNVTPRTNVGTAVTPQSTSITPYIPGFQDQDQYQEQNQDQDQDKDQDKDKDQDQDYVDTPPELLSLELYDFYCPEPNAYYSVASRCDTYVECKSDIAIQHFCPDGLHFNPKTQWPNFPCDYPSKVQCNTGLDIDGLNMSRTRPLVGKPGPAIITHRRSVVTPRPPIITHRPPVIIHQPNIVTLRPNAVTPQPNAVTLLSNTVTLRPNAVTPRPNIVTRQPNVVTTQSNAVTLRLNAVTHRPNAVPLLSNAVTLRRNAVTPRPNAVTLLSNAVTLRPNAVTSQPNAVTHRPNVISRQPNVITPRPNAVTPPPNVVTPQTIVTTSRSIVVTPHIHRLPKQPTVDPPVTKQLSNYSCPESDGFYSVAAKCDEYVECKSDVAIQHSCPDGLHFNPNAHWPDYPCGYPAEVKCRSGAVAQEPKPTVDCPHREGFFPTDSGDCGTYKVCHAGIATVKQCPAGLVFNFETDVCDWPSNVPQCNKVKALEGFDCPAAPANGLISKYRYGRSCKDFVACQDGQPRLLSCDAGKHFNQETESCVDADLIVDCDA